MKKLLLFIVAILTVILVACGEVEDSSNSTLEDETQKEQTSNEKATSDKGEESKKVDSINKKINLDNQFSFQNFVVSMNNAKLYEKDDNVYMDLSFDWRNNYSEDAKFIRAGSVFAYQNDNELEEITYAYSDTSSDVHFPNTVGGEWGIKLTFQLKDKETPIKIMFVAHDSDEEEEILIKIK
ncbi:hypothetical protein [Cytobacillus horneckiae]|uniref:hypothetical protein n=1 Tax=Cytobacillus horneckiae TaxID=549687 RepID=UPI003D9A6D40